MTIVDLIRKWNKVQRYVYVNESPECKRKALSGLEGELEIIGLEVMVESVRAAVHIQRAEGLSEGRELPTRQ